VIHAFAVIAVHAKHLESFGETVPVNPVVRMDASSGAISKSVLSEMRSIVANMIQR
jgi:hypothetical protein